MNRPQRPKRSSNCHPNRSARLSTHIVTEATARARCRDLLEQEHRLGSRRPKGRSLYQVVCRDNVWVGVLLWTG